MFSWISNDKAARWAACAMAVLAGVALTACGGGGGDSGSTESSAAAAAAAPTVDEIQLGAGIVIGETTSFLINGSGLDQPRLKVTADNCAAPVEAFYVSYTQFGIHCTPTGSPVTVHVADTVTGPITSQTFGRLQVTNVSVSGDLRYGNQVAFTFHGVGLSAQALQLSSDECSTLDIDSNAPKTDSQITVKCTLGKATVNMSVMPKSGGAAVSTTPFNVVMPTNPVVTFVTSAGTVAVRLNVDKAPLTGANFIAYVNRHIYEGTILHRVIKSGVDVNKPFSIVQGGEFTGVDEANHTLLQRNVDLDPAIELETSGGLSNTAGTIAMARTSDPNSATRGFFFNVDDNSAQFDPSFFQQGYAVFGDVISGASVLSTINNAATRTVGGYEDVPQNDIVLYSVTYTAD